MSVAPKAPPLSSKETGRVASLLIEVLLTNGMLVFHINLSLLLTDNRQKIFYMSDAFMAVLSEKVLPTKKRTTNGNFIDIVGVRNYKIHILHCCSLAYYVVCYVFNILLSHCVYTSFIED